MIETTIKDLNQALKKHFGFSEFKRQQKQIIESLIEGNDVFVLVPTGGGKSMCYQLPALIQNGIAIVISPLIALMKNQVDSIRGVSQENGIAHVLNSSLSKTEIEKVKSDLKSGVTKLLFVAPESLIKESNSEFLKSLNISFYAIDEAHCISEWGHDFRPEYRNIKQIVETIGKAPIIALTATATLKVQTDIQKSLGMTDAVVFKDSFNRENLFYEVRPKVEPEKQILEFIGQRQGKSGIIYCMSRKKVEEIAQFLQVNGIKALPYHAGLDAKTRAKHQDNFLMEEIDIVVATVAFGMGIDKPDVRFVIHYEMPKSLESYYQETGRAGRDGGEGYCLSFYDYKDIEKMEKLLGSKPMAEREVGLHLLYDVVGYAETAMNRRKYLLNYFGEEFDEVNGPGANMDDNAQNPKELIDVSKDAENIFEYLKKNSQQLKLKEAVNLIVRESIFTASEESIESDANSQTNFFNSLTRQLVVQGYLRKDISSFGELKITEKGKDFIEKPHPIQIALDHKFDELSTKKLGGNQQDKNFAADPTLLKHLTSIRKETSQKHDLPPFAIFQDFSLEDMAIQYPTTLEELSQIFGVGQGKAQKFGQDFIDFITKYVKENGIEKMSKLVVKQVAKNSNYKVHIIQSVDRKLNLEDAAEAKSLSMDQLISEMEGIVYQGTKLNIGYYLNEIIEEEVQEEVFEYLMEAENDSISGMKEEFEDEFEEEELRLLRIKFLSDHAN